MKQTTIEWLLNEFQEIHKDFGGLDLEWLKKFEQAKEMELQMVVDFTKWYDLNYFVYNGFTKTTKIEDMFKIFLKENANKK